MSGQEIVKAAHASLAPVLAMSNPMDGYTDYCPPHDGQVHHGIAVADTAAVLAGDHVQSEVKACFNAPVLSVGFEHLLGIHSSGGAGAE